MTSKELLYLEDALSKENFIVEKMNMIISEINCEDCTKDLEKILKVHQKDAKKLEKILMEE